MIYFTSDTHYFHKNIIDFCERPFKDVDEMNVVLVNNWNRIVGPKDEVYHLGDVSFGRAEKTVEILEQLNGRIYLVRGNHDKGINPDRFEWIKDYYELRWESRKLVLCHFPFAVWNESHHGSIHLHGHSHGTLKNQGRRIDVGVDPMDFIPVSISAIVEQAEQNEPWLEDYHRNRKE